MGEEVPAVVKGELRKTKLLSKSSKRYVGVLSG